MEIQERTTCQAYEIFDHAWRRFCRESLGTGLAGTMDPGPMLEQSQVGVLATATRARAKHQRVRLAPGGTGRPCDSAWQPSDTPHQLVAADGHGNSAQCYHNHKASPELRGQHSSLRTEHIGKGARRTQPPRLTLTRRHPGGPGTARSGVARARPTIGMRNKVLVQHTVTAGHGRQPHSSAGAARRARGHAGLRQQAAGGRCPGARVCRRRE